MAAPERPIAHDGYQDGHGGPETTASIKRIQKPPPPGMRRASYYMTEQAAEALDSSAREICHALGVPKNEAITALILATTEHTAQVIIELAAQRDAVVKAHLEKLTKNRKA